MARSHGASKILPDPVSFSVSPGCLEARSGLCAGQLPSPLSPRQPPCHSQGVFLVELSAGVVSDFLANRPPNREQFMAILLV